jgi:hypothetical protein
MLLARSDSVPGETARLMPWPDVGRDALPARDSRTSINVGMRKPRDRLELLLVYPSHMHAHLALRRSAPCQSLRTHKATQVAAKVVLTGCMHH